MATAQELKEKLEKERGAYEAFKTSHTTAVNGKAVWDFGTGDEAGANQIKFNEHTKAMNDAFDAWDAVRVSETQAAELEAKMTAADREGARPRVPNGGIYNGGQESDAERQQQGAAIKTLGELFMESAAYKANCDKTPGSGGVNQPFIVELPNGGMAVTRDSEAAAWAIKADPMVIAGQVAPFPAVPGRRVEFAARRPVLRNLMPVQDTTINGQAYQTIPVVRETTQTLNADEVAEGALKPLSELGETRDTITLITIAHRFHVTNQALMFIPDLRERIDRKGTLGVQLAEENKMLNYNGSAGWKGLMVQTGVQDAAKSTDDEFTAFHRGMTLVATGGAAATGSYAQVTGFVVHDNDWHTIVTKKDLQNRFIYGDPSAVTPTVRLWGVPGIKTVAATEGTVVMGDFATQAVWWVSGNVRFIVGLSGNDLDYNRQTIVIEEFGALELDLYAAFLRMSGF